MIVTSYSKPRELHYLAGKPIPTWNKFSVYLAGDGNFGKISNNTLGTEILDSAKMANPILTAI